MRRLRRLLAGRVEPVVLVLDDFHEVAAAVGDQVDRLLAHPPAALRIVVTTRRDPPLRLGRLRLAAALGQIRSADLACTEEETAAVLEGAGVRVAAPLVKRLWKRTEGWMAGVSLAAIRQRDVPEPAEFVDSFDGEEMLVADYLMAEVLSRQPPEVQDFLLRTSVVEVLDGALAAALTGCSDAHERLAALAHDGVMLTAVDRRARWFRYHSLFAELLRARLRWRDPDEVSRPHGIAARWYADHAEIAQSVRQAVLGRDWPLAAVIAGDHWLDLLLVFDVVAGLWGSADQRVAAALGALAGVVFGVLALTAMPRTPE